MLEGIGLIKKGGKNHIRWTEAEVKQKQINVQQNINIAHDNNHNLSHRGGLSDHRPINPALRRENNETANALRDVDPVLRERYLAAELENKKILSMDKKLDSLIKILEEEKQNLKSDISYQQYAYVTHEDLKKVNWKKKSSSFNQQSHLNNPQAAAGEDQQSLLLAIQTPHGSQL